MSVPLRFAIVGCGGVAATHAIAISELECATLIGCYDINAERAVSFARKWGCHALEDFPMRAERSEIDVAIVCTPSGLHFDAASAVATRGIHVLVEKPLEITTAKCEALIRICDSAGVKLGTIFPSRFRSSYQMLKDAICNRKFGQIAMVHANVPWHRNAEYFASVPWRGTLSLDGGGCLMNQGIHIVDLLIWMLGPPVSVSCTKSRLTQDIEGEDAISVTMRFAGETIGILNVTTIAYPGFPRSIQVWGSEGCGTATDVAFVMAETRIDPLSVGAIPDGASAHGNPLALDSTFHRLAIVDFVSAVRSNTVSQVTAIDGRNAVEVVEAAYLSAATNRTIYL